VAAPAALAGGGGNLVLLASPSPIDAAGIAAELATMEDPQEVVSGDATTAFIGDAEVLTDDHAPVDQLITPR
jgi:hypothetical protein